MKQQWQDQPRWSRVLRDNWHWVFSSVVVLTGLLVVAAGRAPGWMFLVPGASELRVVAQTVLPSWLGGDPRIRRAEDALAHADAASEAALEARVAELDLFFAGQKAGAPAFADEVLGLWGKLTYAENLLVDAANTLQAFFSGQPTYGPDANRKLLDAVCDAFYLHVLEPGEVDAAMKRAADGYASDLRAIEATLFGDPASGGDTIDPHALVASLGFAPSAFSFDGAADIAAKDLGVGLVQYLIADQLGNAAMAVLEGLAESLGIAGAIDWKAKFAAGQGLDAAADAGLDSLRKQLGYTPEENIIRHAERAVDEARRELIDGSGDEPGFRARLRALHDKRALWRREAVRRRLAAETAH